MDESFRRQVVVSRFERARRGSKPTRRTKSKNSKLNPTLTRIPLKANVVYCTSMFLETILEHMMLLPESDKRGGKRRVEEKREEERSRGVT